MEGIIFSRKEVLLDKLYNMNIDGELPPQPEIIIIRNK
jgi:hypothetical protein